MNQNMNLEESIFQYIDKIKELLSPDIWQNILLDCTKNELLVLWYLFRHDEANMTQLAEYIHVPLNTATGIIARMEKRELVSRQRSIEDKRVVTIHLGSRGRKQMQDIVKEVMYYGSQVMESFQPEEIDILFRMLNKLTDILSKERKAETEQKKVRKITIE